MPKESKDDNESEVNYSATYVVKGNHSLIIISKGTVVLASFGLYGTRDRFKEGYLLQGAFSERGRIRSEHYLLGHYSEFYGITFSITQDQALDVLEQVKKDSEINLSQKEKKDSGSNINFSVDIYNHLTPKEQELFKWFRIDLNQHASGGPDFNARDFNCKNYAMYILRKLGIHDEVEKGRYPEEEGPRMRVISFSDHDRWLWSSKVFQNLRQPKYKTEFPSGYFEIYFAHKTAIEGALALLDAYATFPFLSHFLHPRRHYCKELRVLLNEIRNNPKNFTELATVISYLNHLMPPHRNMNGDLQQRLDFLTHMQHQNFETAKKIRQMKALQEFNFDDFETRLVNR